ncbi:TadE/TadG family type IV pilus assembly protein [Erythrobacter ani]|uniref:Pilus assembly protein n=1 Tax=Erythrobacter ani TaxID=2827235 RepID=A0ABS6SLD5_9SPHN|nr:TadE/TadG family type IV pilus assembly protein [Erythrobacter ani]MBV7265858.1 pilus assembly protein [Erythrobacter ani]
MIRRFRLDTRAAAATEFALALPMMLALMFVSMEAGHFFWTEHKLVKSVRDGARFATRLSVDEVCNGATNVMSPALEGQIKNLTVTGQIAAGGLPKVPGWTASNVQVTVGCQAFVGTGIYTDLGAPGPLVTVSSGNVRYPSILNGLGVIDDTVNIRAESSAAVVGI